MPIPLPTVWPVDEARPLALRLPIGTGSPAAWLTGQLDPRHTAASEPSSAAFADPDDTEDDDVNALLLFG